MTGRRRAGGVLLEVLIAIALFAGAASLTLAVATRAGTAMDRARLDQVAVDLARTALAELEAGTLTVADLRDGRRRGVGSTARDRASGAIDDPVVSWRYDVEIDRTEFAGLSLVTVTVWPEAPDGFSEPGQSSDFPPEAVTLRQLLPVEDIGP